MFVAHNAYLKLNPPDVRPSVPQIELVSGDLRMRVGKYQCQLFLNKKIPKRKIMKNIVEYLIVTGPSPKEIERQIELKLCNGYQPFGSLCAMAAGRNTGTLYAQPVVKYEGTDNEARREIEKVLSEFHGSTQTSTLPDSGISS